MPITPLPAPTCQPPATPSLLPTSWCTPGVARREPPAPLRLCPQVSVAFQDLAVRFSEDEWQLLGEGQRALYQDVMRENYETLLSLGKEPARPAGQHHVLSRSGPGGP